MPKHHTGDCLCGNIRFKIGEIKESGFCHCSQCKKMTGTTVLAHAMTQIDQFVLIQGEPKRFERKNGYSYFCGECGSQLYYQSKSSGYLSVCIGSLDEPERVRPSHHQFFSEKITWMSAEDGLPKYDKFRPKTAD